MPSRREFIQTGLAASALAAFPLTALPTLADTTNEEPYPLFKVVFDQTLPAGEAFGAEATRRGAPATAVGGNAGGVWMNEIEPRWKRGPAVLAGLTDRSSLFCFELLARDYGMAVVYRAEHCPTSGGIRHVITGPEGLSAWQSRLTAAGQRWSTVAAQMVMNCPAILGPERRIGLLDLAQPSSVPGPSLFSWVIAPARRPGLLGKTPKRG